MKNDLQDPTEEIVAPMHRRATDTERAASDLITPRAGTLRAKALNAFMVAGDRGLTDHELSEVTGVYLYSIAPRRNELTRMGWLVDSGRRRMGSHQGHTAIVWTLSTGGENLLSA